MLWNLPARTLWAAGSGLQAGSAQGAAETPEQKAVAAIPQYRPRQEVSGVLRLWGHGAPKLDFMGVLVKTWEDEFQSFQPGIRFEYDMYGTASAMGALYSGAGDIAILGQEIYPFEVTAFESVKHYPPQVISIATGSLDVRNFDFAIVVFVHRTNPLARLTLEQLNRVFAYQRNPGANITSWGQLGLQGHWKDRPIRLYGWRADDVFSTFLQNRVLHGSHEWRCGVKEFAHIHRTDGTIYDSGKQILNELANDADGIAFSNYRYQNDEVKPVAIAWRIPGPYWQATKETLINQQYPLGRTIPAVIDRVPGRPVDVKVREFLLYLLSREGQQQIVNNGKYLPLNPGAAAAGRRQLA